MTGNNKVIKSGLKETNRKRYNDFRDDMFNAIQKVFEKYNFQEDKENRAGKNDLMEVIKWMEYHYYFDDDWDNEEIESACGSKGKKKKGKKEIKSSLEDRLFPYLEEFEEGYADTINRDAEEGSYGAYEEAFIEGFKNDYNLTDEDIDKLRESVHEIWEASSTDSDEVRDMGEMYGVPRGASSEEALKHFE